MALPGYDMATLPEFAGKEIGVSDRQLSTRLGSTRFAECTGDRQWIHVDVERAARKPVRRTIAHGYLTRRSRRPFGSRPA